MASRRQLLRNLDRWFRYHRHYPGTMYPPGEERALLRLAIHSSRHRPQDWHLTERPSDAAVPST